MREGILIGCKRWWRPKRRPRLGQENRADRNSDRSHDGVKLARSARFSRRERKVDGVRLVMIHAAMMFVAVTRLRHIAAVRWNHMPVVDLMRMVMGVNGAAVRVRVGVVVMLIAMRIHTHSLGQPKANQTHCTDAKPQPRATHPGCNSP